MKFGLYLLVGFFLSHVVADGCVGNESTMFGIGFYAWTMLGMNYGGGRFPKD
jgi:hypothetical protein